LKFKVYIWFTLLSLESLAQKSEWTSLFNGQDLSGWNTYVDRPHASLNFPERKKNDAGKYTEPFGFNVDPLSVFSVVKHQDQALIRISGQIFGMLFTKNDFQNYHLKLKYKWGKAKWPPRLSFRKDSGLLFHCFNPEGGIKWNWFPGHECQIQEGDTGDYWPTGADVFIDIPAVKTDTSTWLVYQKNAEKKTLFFSKNMSERRVLRPKNYEKGEDQWNNLELLCWDDTAIFILNGQPLMYAYNSKRQVGQEKIKLNSGKIALQSEGAEIFYKDIYIKTLTKKPNLFKDL
jgi:hypothetical protein